MRGLERGAGCLSLVAAAVHGGVTPEHFSLWWGYGLFFLAATLAQAVFGLLFLTRGTDAARGWPWSRARRPLCAAGILGNLLLVAMWAVSRTVGVPGVGPEAGEVEAVGAVDVLRRRYYWR